MCDGLETMLQQTLVIYGTNPAGGGRIHFKPPTVALTLFSEKIIKQRWIIFSLRHFAIGCSRSKN
jgi:hypothetical protein